MEDCNDYEVRLKMLAESGPGQTPSSEEIKNKLKLIKNNLEKTLRMLDSMDVPETHKQWEQRWIDWQNGLISGGESQILDD